MGLINTFDINSNFWQVNPQMIIPKEFKSIHDSDKTEDKSYSSQIMWSISLIYDPESKFFKLSEEDRIQLIEEDYLGKKFNVKKYTPAIELYKKLNITQLQRSAINLDKKMAERDTFINDTEYNSESASMLDKMIVDSDKIFNLRNKIQEELLKEKNITGTTREGTTETASDRKDI